MKTAHDIILNPVITEAAGNCKQKVHLQGC